MAPPLAARALLASNQPVMQTRPAGAASHIDAATLQLSPTPDTRRLALRFVNCGFTSCFANKSPRARPMNMGKSPVVAVTLRHLKASDGAEESRTH